MKDLAKFYHGKRIFITGHTGFKGSWLAQVLVSWGAVVKGFALSPDAANSHFSALDLESKIDHQIGDITNSEDLKQAISDFRPDIVMHLAAQALVRESYKDPKTTFNTNVMGSLNLLDAVNACDSVKALVYITSDKCYENLEWVWGYRETDPMGGFDPYSASKAAAEILFSSYSRSYFCSKDNFSCASARAGNVIGGGDYAADRIIPDCVHAAKSNSTVELRNPNATRPWQHVLEPLSGYLVLGRMLLDQQVESGSAWNFGPSAERVITVEEVANRIFKILGAGELIIDSSDEHPHEAGLLQLNCDKAHAYLGWNSHWSGDVAITKTAEWYREVNLGGSAEDVTNSQIKEYFNGN
ncbi:CDP-glucose 4,6-dehydratase [Gammaproteobacteria bacterium]|nr:CDP-glucose 4,6-dehydratase [Gammaproteobacteria bacterium]